MPRKAKACPPKNSRNGVTTAPDGAERCDHSPAGSREYMMRRDAMAERQGNACACCGQYLDGQAQGMLAVTFDHEAGRGHGGGHTDDRIEIDGRWHNAALHYFCNGMKASKRYAWRQNRMGEYRPVEEV